MNTGTPDGNRFGFYFKLLLTAESLGNEFTIARLDNTDGVGAIEETRFYIHNPAPGKGGLDDLVLEYDGASNAVHRYLHGARIDQLFADEDALNELTWPLNEAWRDDGILD